MMMSGQSWIPKTLPGSRTLTRASARLLDVWGRCWVGAGVTVRHPCHMPAGPGLLSWCQGTRSRRRTAVNKPVRWESKGRAESRPVVEVYVKHTPGPSHHSCLGSGGCCVLLPLMDAHAALARLWAVQTPLYSFILLACTFVC